MRAPISSRRDFLRLGAVSVAASGVAPQLLRPRAHAAVPEPGGPPSRPFITPEKDFVEVVRLPKPHELSATERAAVGLAPETWRLEITADPFVEYPHTKVPAAVQRPLTLTDGTALDWAGLLALGRQHEVHYFKAMQCLNVEAPLGQGLWTGVPLREVLRLCGRLNNVRRIYYWGYHWDDPKLIYKASVTYSQAMETPPGGLPVLLAYRLNGEPISPVRGGPVRLIVPWSHGYKSMKWVQHIFLTNDARNHDSYALGNNDSESILKTAAYVDQPRATVPAGQPVHFTGQAISGPSGLRRVEYWVRPIGRDDPARLEGDDPAVLAAPWAECQLDPEPRWAEILPGDVPPGRLCGFDRATGRPLVWPLPYCIVHYRVTVRGLDRGRYEVRARSVDLNGLAQPEPRPLQKNGRNAIQVRRFEVV